MCQQPDRAQGLVPKSLQSLLCCLAACQGARRKSLAATDTPPPRGTWWTLALPTSSSPGCSPAPPAPPFFSIFCSPKLMLLGLSSFINKDKIIWKCQGVGGGGSSHVARSPRPPDSWLAPLPIPFMPKFCSLRAHWLMPLHP